MIIHFFMYVIGAVLYGIPGFYIGGYAYGRSLSKKLGESTDNQISEKTYADAMIDGVLAGMFWILAGPAFAIYRPAKVIAVAGVRKAQTSYIPPNISAHNALGMGDADRHQALAAARKEVIETDVLSRAHALRAEDVTSPKHHIIETILKDMPDGIFETEHQG